MKFEKSQTTLWYWPVDDMDTENQGESTEVDGWIVAGAHVEP